MNQERETPKFQGIADPKCRCTPESVCVVCRIKTHGEKISWADAVKRNNAEVKNGG